MRRANFVALTPTIRPSRANFFASVDAGPPAHHRSPRHKERDRAWPRHPRAVVRPCCGTREQYPLQTSSNRSNLKPLVRTHVTNVVNLRPKTTIFSEKAVGLTTFVTTDQKSTQKTPPIDDVCNNTQRSVPKSQHDKPAHIRVRRARLRRPWAAAGPGRTSRRRAEPHISDEAPLAWRAPEGLVGLAAAPVGGGGAWPGFETTR